MPAGLNRPGVLEPGDLVALVAPSRPASERGTREAAAYLEQLGYRVEISPSIHDRHYYLAGTDETRAAELNRVFAAPEIRAVFCARGGFGSGRLLDRLEYDAVRSDPKVVAGFSDSTALLLALYSRARLAVFNGALADFDLGKRRDPLVEASLWPLVTSPEPLGEVPEAAESMGVVRPGTARGPLVPANLALLCSLLGTPFFPPLDGALLVLEDIEGVPLPHRPHAQPAAPGRCLRASRRPSVRAVQGLFHRRRDGGSADPGRARPRACPGDRFPHRRRPSVQPFPSPPGAAGRGPGGARHLGPLSQDHRSRRGESGGVLKGNFCRDPILSSRIGRLQRLP